MPAPAPASSKTRAACGVIKINELRACVSAKHVGMQIEGAQEGGMPGRDVACEKEGGRHLPEDAANEERDEEPTHGPYRSL